MKAELVNPFISTEEDVEVDDQTAAAIRRGIADADAGRVVTLEEARKRMGQWLLKSSLPTER